MFNVHLHDKRVQAKARGEQEAAHQSKLRERSVVLRSVLAATYSKRVDQFILTMMNDPIQVRQHVGPLPVAGRDTDPDKYKGSTSMIMKGYRTEMERVKEAVAANQYLSLEPMKPHEFRSRDQSKEINPSMYFTSKPKAVKTVLAPRKSMKRRSSIILSRDFLQLNNKYKPPPKISTSVIDLDRKTHFKGVMSKLMNLSVDVASTVETVETEENAQVYQRTKTASILWKHAKVLSRTSLQQYEGASIAKEVLQTCQVVPKGLGETFLHVGEGKLISNPFLPNREVYSHLYPNHSITSSSFSL